jgi:hypothetical protein
MQKNKNSVVGRVLSIRETGSGGPGSILPDLVPHGIGQRLCQSTDQGTQETKDARAYVMAASCSLSVGPGMTQRSIERRWPRMSGQNKSDRLVAEWWTRQKMTKDRGYTIHWAWKFFSQRNRIHGLRKYHRQTILAHYQTCPSSFYDEERHVPSQEEQRDVHDHTERGPQKETDGHRTARAWALTQDKLQAGTLLLALGREDIL